ncbi:MAG: helix-turn-helix transcriptional regulator [Planctomycetota bacterium]
MIIEATLARSGRWWAIEIPVLQAATQARTKAESLAMAASVVDDLAGRSLGTTAWFEGERIFIQSEDSAGLVALVLRQKRCRAGLTLQQMASRLGSRSPNSYARYESGRTVPSVAVLDRLLRAVDGRGLVLG